MSSSCSCCHCSDSHDNQQNTCNENEHNHEHNHGNKFKPLFKIGITIIFLIIAEFACRFHHPTFWQTFFLYLVIYLYITSDIIIEAIKGIIKGKFMDENFLMTIATIGALCIGFFPDQKPEYLEAIMVILFFKLGEYLEDIAVSKSKKSIKTLIDKRSKTANLVINGEAKLVDVKEVVVGDVIQVKVGELIPLDGTVIDGSTYLDTQALTGESMPRKVVVGDEALSGCVNQTSVIQLRVTKTFKESTASKVIDLVDDAVKNKAKSERFISKFSKIYTPIVVALAIIIAFIPPLFTSSYSANFGTWLLRALTFLVISCPCALVISVPLTYFGGIGKAASKGILIKGANYIDSLSRLKTVVFDKTGTLTHGIFKITMIHSQNYTEEDILRYVIPLEKMSNHPIAKALTSNTTYNFTADVKNVEEIAGKGLKGEVNGKVVCVGNKSLALDYFSNIEDCGYDDTIIYVIIDNEYIGHIHINDTIKDDAKDAIAQMRANGVNSFVMLTGDKANVAQNVAETIGLDSYKADLLPSDKLSNLESILNTKKSGETLAYIGDGINDAPTLARADIGISMGQMGSDVAIEASDVVIMNDKLSYINKAIQISKKTHLLVIENIVFAIGVKVIILLLASLGLANMWMAIFADVGVTLLVILNSLRILVSKK